MCRGSFMHGGVRGRELITPSCSIRKNFFMIRKGAAGGMEEEYGEQEGQNAEQTEFRLNMDILDEQTGIATTLGDQYGYNVFSEEFQESVASYEEKKEQEREEYIRCVFEQERNDDMEEVFDAVFSSEAQIVVKAEYQEDSGKAGNLSFTVGFVLIGMFFTGILLFVVQKMRKERRRNAVDSYSDWTK